MKLLIVTLTVLVLEAQAQFLELRVRPARPADLALVFHRPAEPVFTARGVHRREAFDVPDSFLPDRYRRVASKLRADRWRSSLQLIEVRDLPMPMDRFADVHTAVPFRSLYLREPATLSITVRFWHFFDESETFEELLARAVWAKLNFQPDMILEALVMTILRSKRPDVKAIPLPEQTQYFPEYFINQEFYGPAREEMHSVSNDADRVAIPVVRNEAEDEENKVWYFRTDIHFNQMHWRWHYLNPSSSDDVAYADLPRRGESFVYLHKTFVSRYNAERFSVGLPAVLPMDVHAPLPNGYFPKLFRLHSSKAVPGRQDFSLLSDKDVATHEKSMERYREVLRNGFVKAANGTVTKVEGLPGLDVISNLLEGNILFSPDFDFYGDIHNNLHSMAIGANDLGGLHKEIFAVEAYFPVSINDPVFFNIHMYMESTYEEYRTQYLKPYSKEQLTPLPNVVLQSVVAQTEGLQNPGDLRTFWQESDLDVSLGLDFVSAGRLYARFTHLQHRRFNYKLQIDNNTPTPKRVFVRLYLLMTFDGSGSPLDASFQRQFAMQMDIFSTTLRPGANEVLRRSTDSAFTTDWDEIYMAQKGDMPPEMTHTVNLCRNGWPQNLLLPRGSPTGMPYKLFAMVTDYDEDKAPDSAAEKCPRGWVLSGVHGVTNYPDRRAMGFPFDRPYRQGVASLQDFLTDNMAISDVVVTFEDLIEPPTPLLPGGASTSWLPPTVNRA